jgi:hypothetical protein
MQRRPFSYDAAGRITHFNHDATGTVDDYTEDFVGATSNLSSNGARSAGATVKACK